AAVRAERTMASTRGRERFLITGGIVLGVLMTAACLAVHSVTWSLARLETERIVQGEVDRIPDELTAGFRAVLGVSLVLALFVWGLWIYCYRRPESVERILARADRIIGKVREACTSAPDAEKRGTGEPPG